MEAAATCRVCTETAPLNEGICSHCLEVYGRRGAVFLARAQVDPEFANATLSRLEPPARGRMLAALSRRYLGKGPGLRKARPTVEVGHRRVAG